MGLTHFSYKQPHFRVEPRVAIKIPKMRLKVAMKLLNIFGIEACLTILGSNVLYEKQAKIGKIDVSC